MGREEILAKRGNKCEECGQTYDVAFLDVHHEVDGTLKVLCRKCHINKSKPQMKQGIIKQEEGYKTLSPFKEPPIIERRAKGAGRQKIDRHQAFRLIALNKSKAEIKKALGLAERTHWRIMTEWNKLSVERQLGIREGADKEEKAKEKFIDYEFVQKWVARMKAERIKSWKPRFNACRRIWLILQKKNPENWTEEDIKIRAIPELRKTVKSVFIHLVSVRGLRPDLQDKISTKREKLAPTFEWKYIYERIMQGGKLETFLKVGGFKRELVKGIHVTLGCREGGAGEGGVLGLEWGKVNWEKKTIDVFEGKTGGGFYWLNCPLNLFGDHIFEMLQQYWTEQGKPTSGKIFADLGYHSARSAKRSDYLNEIYKEASEAIGEKYGEDGIVPHFARKLHACLLIDADVPLEMVAGDKPFGIMGVGWEDLSTLKKYYLAFRKSKVEENRQKAKQFNI